MRRVSVFGATGSIGCNTLDLLRRQGGAGAYDVIALSGNGNIPLLARQAREFRAKIAITADENRLADLRAALQGTDTVAAAGASALAEAAARPTDWVMSAIGGCSGLEPGLISLQHGGILALANKESLVAAGPLMLATAARHGLRQPWRTPREFVPVALRRRTLLSFDHPVLGVVEAEGFTLSPTETAGDPKRLGMTTAK